MTFEENKEMTLKEMKAKIVKNYTAFKTMLELQECGYDEETAVGWIYGTWFEKED